MRLPPPSLSHATHTLEPRRRDLLPPQYGEDQEPKLPETGELSDGEPPDGDPDY